LIGMALLGLGAALSAVYTITRCRCISCFRVCHAVTTPPGSPQKPVLEPQRRPGRKKALIKTPPPLDARDSAVLSVAGPGCSITSGSAGAARQRWPSLRCQTTLGDLAKAKSATAPSIPVAVTSVQVPTPSVITFRPARFTPEGRQQRRCAVVAAGCAG
jgi:hypothetical protein